MSLRLVRERIVLALPLTVAILTFYLTRGAGADGAGHTSPGAFPRLVATALAVFAFARFFMPVTQDQSPNNTDTWGWEQFLRAMGVVGLMVFYIFLFARVPFLPVTIVFLFAVFVIFEVKPIARAALCAVGAAVLLYVLFLYLLGIAV